MMTKHIIILSVFLMSSFLTSVLATESNKVYLGPGFQKNQQSTKEILYKIPKGWIFHEKETQKYGLVAVLLPENKTLAQTDKAITIAFQEKDALKSGLRNLEEFFRVDMQHTLQQFPEMKAARWQPSKLNPDRIKFMSIEICGVKKNEPSPARILFIDSGDGFYSITLTVESKEELRNKKYEDFFNSIGLKTI